MLSTTVVAPYFVVNCEPTGPYRRVLFLAKASRPMHGLEDRQSPFAPRAEPRIIDGNCATVPNMDPRSGASSLQSLRQKRPILVTPASSDHGPNRLPLILITTIRVRFVLKWRHFRATCL